MNMRKRIYNLSVAALLCAIGILIPLIMPFPFKILIEPASFTLGSHVAIFIAMFISPFTAVLVTIGTTLGFFIAGFPPVIVARAASQIVFATIGALILKRRLAIIDSLKKATIFSLGMALIHGVCEVIVSLPFYFLKLMSPGYYDKGLFVSIFLLVGVGTMIHSMIDFYIAYLIWRPIKKATSAKAVVE